MTQKRKTFFDRKGNINKISQFVDKTCYGLGKNFVYCAQLLKALLQVEQNSGVIFQSVRADSIRSSLPKVLAYGLNSTGRSEYGR